MFSPQIHLLEVLPAIRQLLQTYQQPQEWLAGVEQQTRHFLVRVPFVGAFSSGKSSLLNALMGESLLSTNVDPQTSIPAELAYGKPERFTLCLPDDTVRPLARSQVLELQAGQAPAGAWLDLHVECDTLARLPHLKLVDMPGWDSGNGQHGRAIDDYVERSLAYCIVVSAEEGGLHASIRAALAELQLHDMPVIAVISKADKKSPDDVQEVARQVAREIEGISGRAPLRVVTVSARTHMVRELDDALQELEALAEPLFLHSVTRPFLARLRPLVQYLDVLLNREDLDREKIVLEKMRVAEEIKLFETRLGQETAQLDASLPAVLEAILLHVRNRLHEQLEAWTVAALGGRDVSAQIDQAIRLGMTSGIQAEFDVVMRRYFDRVGDFTPAVLDIDLRIPGGASVAKDTDAGIDRAMIHMVADQAIDLLASRFPVAKVLKPLLLGLIDILQRIFANRGKAEVAQAQRHEEIRMHLLNQVFPQIQQAARTALQTTLQAHVQQAKAGIVAAAEQQLAQRQAALAKLDADLAQGDTAFQQKRRQYEIDRHAVQSIIDACEQP